MKFQCEAARNDLRRSRPARGGWIEMAENVYRTRHVRSRPARGGWIEMLSVLVFEDSDVSRPARGGWIEILVRPDAPHNARVPPRKGRVD